MKEIYKQILEKALPLYEKGREGDVEHIKWLYKIVPKFADKYEIDFDILIPVVILHDIGYSKVSKGSNPMNLDTRKLHMEEGAKIASEILEGLKYPKNKIAEIKRLVSKHDNWAFGDNYADEPVLRLFNNFDMLWVLTKEGFIFYQEILGKSSIDTYHQIEKDVEVEHKEGRKWFNQKIEEFYKQLMKEHKEGFYV